MGRPEYVTCIEHPVTIKATWCGKDSRMAFVFVDLNHAATNGLVKGRLVACKECTDAATKALTTGQE